MYYCIRLMFTNVTHVNTMLNVSILFSTRTDLRLIFFHVLLILLALRKYLFDLSRIAKPLYVIHAISHWYTKRYKKMFAFHSTFPTSVAERRRKRREK